MGSDVNAATVGALEAVGKGGGLVLAALILFGVFFLAHRFVPPFIAALNANAAATTAQTGAIDRLRDTVLDRANAHDRKDDDILDELRRVATRQSEIATDVATQEGIALGAAVATGRHAAVTVERPPLDSPFIEQRARQESRPTLEEIPPSPYRNRQR